VHLLISVLAAVAGSLVLGTSAVIEQRGTKRVRRRRPLSPWLLLDLARQPLWLAGIAANVAGFALQVVALRFGPLAVVEPILVADLIFAVLITAAQRRRWDPVMMAGTLACAGGVAGFLVIARPSGGQPSVRLSAVLPLGAVLAAAVAGCLVLAQLNLRARPLALALACGIDFGVAAFMAKLVTSEFGGGLPAVLGHWPVYALAITGPAGFLLNQSAYQQGTLIAPVLAVITATDPLVSIGVAHFLLHEKLAGSSTGVAGTVASLLLMTAGIIVLAHHSPVVVRQRAEAQPVRPSEQRAGGTGSGS
jgi:hypothetical protein